MSLLTPEIGLVFWMLVAFGIVVFILSKYGFPFIIKGVEKRNQFIEDSLTAAKEAFEDLENVRADGARLLEETKKQQVKILAEAMETRESIIKEANQKAEREADEIIADARKQIANEKENAIRDIRKEVVFLSFDVAEKLLRKNLSKPDDQEAFVNQLIDEMNLKN